MKLTGYLIRLQKSSWGVPVDVNEPVFSCHNVAALSNKDWRRQPQVLTFRESVSDCRTDRRVSRATDELCIGMVFKVILTWLNPLAINPPMINFYVLTGCGGPQSGYRIIEPNSTINQI